MKLINYLSTHKMSILSVLLVAAAAALGADSGFAMAIDPVVPAADANPSGTGPRGTEPGGMSGRPADEQPIADLAGIKTVMEGKAATATDVRDAGLEAEDYDKDVVLFNKFKYASETILASKVKPIKVNSYVVEHFRVGQPDLDAVYSGSSAISIAAKAKTLEIAVSNLDNEEVLTEYSTVIVDGVEGYAKDAAGTEYADGALQLFVLNHKDGSNKVQFQIINGREGGTISIPAGTKLLKAATAGHESQMKVAPVTFLPDKKPAILQKKIATCIITDAFKEQAKKTPLGQADVIKYTTDIFKRECARTHWLGQEGRIDVKTSTGNREAAYMEKGILRQIPMLYTHGASLQGDDLMAISAMMFTEWAQNDNATAFVGKNEMKRLMNLVNGTATHFKDIAKVEVNDYGIKVRKYTDNFGSIEFIYDQTLDELGYSDYMVVLDLSSMVRYYMRDDKVQTQDMKKTGEALEAEIWNISRIDCYCLKGGNALIACPAANATVAAKLGGITAKFTKTTSSSYLATLSPGTKYYCTADLAKSSTDSTVAFKAGTLIEYNADFGAWEQFEGRLFA